MTRQLHLNAFLMGCGHHEAAWRLPDSDPFAHTDLAHWTNLAQIAERGTFDHRGSLPRYRRIAAKRLRPYLAVRRELTPTTETSARHSLPGP